MGKARVTLGDIPLAGTSAVTWRFQTGTQPYSSIMMVHRDDWPYLRGRMGREIDLVIRDQRGVESRIQRLTILHEVASDSPYRRAFLVSDIRWKWPYRLIVRDYNIPRRSGDTVAVGNLPYEGTVTVDQYDYRAYSLKDGSERWTARECVEDVLKTLTKEKSNSGPTRPGYVIESFPFRSVRGEARGDIGALSIQNVTLRDPGDAALARILGYVPGAEVYIDADGQARVFNAANLAEARALLHDLPPSTYAGDAPALIDRRAIRPSKVIVHYQREVEALFEYQDDFGPTVTGPNRDALFVENVIPTVEPLTDFPEYDPILDELVSRKVGAGTYVEVRQWLDKMDEIRTHESFEWKFKTIALGFPAGKLDFMLGSYGDGVGVDTELINAGMRVQALTQHFRQTFRINRRYTERLRDLLPYRVGVLDTVTGARAPAAVWAEACILPNHKGMAVNSRVDPDLAIALMNIYIPEVTGKSIAEEPPAPALVSVLDPDLGVYRLDWITSPYGTMAQIIPSNLVDESQSVDTISRDLSKQTERCMGFGIRAAGQSNGRLLRERWAHKALMTIVPAAPNNKWQFHRQHITADKVHKQYVSEYGILHGDGPPLELFVPPTELTARYQWTNDDQARATIVKLLGLDEDDPNKAGIQDDDPSTEEIDESALEGFTLVNEERELTEHAIAVAAEALINFADSWQGRVASTMPEKLRLAGNVLGMSIQVGAYPGAKVEAFTDFPGQQRPIARFALMAQSVRELVLGVLPFGGKRS